MSCDHCVKESAPATIAGGMPQDQSRATWGGKKTGQDLRAEVDAHLEELARLTDEARISDEMGKYLNVMSQFHRYSLHNVCMILRHRPEATRVAGYKTWQKVKRQVNRGEKGIPIIVPRPYKKEAKDPLTGERKTEEGVYFGVGYVFDVAQTSGEPLPTAPEWDTQGEEGAELGNRLTACAEHFGVSVEEAELPSGCQGVSMGGRIALRPGITPLGKATTLSHELAHEMLHQGNAEAFQDRSASEMEAEAVSYVVCRHFGLQTNAPNYLALWHADSKKLRERMERISGTARKIITFVEEGGDKAPTEESEGE